MGPGAFRFLFQPELHSDFKTNVAEEKIWGYLPSNNLLDPAT